jgi:hypothetical protein
MSKHNHHYNRIPDCTPRIESTRGKTVLPTTTSFVLPDNSTPIDLLITELTDDTPESTEIVTNATKLISTCSSVRSCIVATTNKVNKNLFEAITQVSKGKSTLQDAARESATYMCEELMLLFVFGFLSGTAVGFAAGLKFAPDDENGDEDYDDNDDGPDYDGPMV